MISDSAGAVDFEYPEDENDDERLFRDNLTELEQMQLRARQAAFLMNAGLTGQLSIRQVAADHRVKKSLLHKYSVQLAEKIGTSFALCWKSTAEERQRKRKTADSRKSAVGSTNGEPPQNDHHSA